MCNPNFINLAIDHVLALDTPDHLIPVAIANQAKRLGQLDYECGFDTDWVPHSEDFASLQ
jgi:hypothetical protein